MSYMITREESSYGELWFQEKSKVMVSYGYRRRVKLW